MSFINNTANFNQGILGIFFPFGINDNSVVRLLLGNKTKAKKVYLQTILILIKIVIIMMMINNAKLIK